MVLVPLLVGSAVQVAMREAERLSQDIRKGTAPGTTFCKQVLLAPKGRPPPQEASKVFFGNTERDIVSRREGGHGLWSTFSRIFDRSFLFFFFGLSTQLIVYFLGI